VKSVACWLLKVIADAPVNFVPAIMTDVPTGPLVGRKVVMVGFGTVTVKLVALVAVPEGVVTVIVPVVAVAGTMAVIDVAFETVKVVASDPLKETLVAPVRLAPEIVILVPTGPLSGLNDVIVGAGIVTVKYVALVAVPVGVLTVIGPVVALAGTVALAVVELTTEKVVAFVPLKAAPVAPPRLVPTI